MNPEFFYNNSTQYEEGYLADTPNAWLLGVARLRQLRIKKGKILNVFRGYFVKERRDLKHKKEVDPSSEATFSKRNLRTNDTGTDK